MKTTKILLLSMFVLTTSAFLAGGQNNALYFDGSNDFVKINTFDPTLTGDISVELWFNAETWTNTNFPGLVSRRTSYESMDWELYYNQSAGSIQLSFGNFGANLVFDLLNVNPSTGSWHHLAFTFNNATDVFTLYLDGINRGTETVPGASLTAGQPLYLGSLDDQWDRFEGYLDEVRIWNDVRTEQELRQNMYTELAGSEENLVAYYRFNETSGTTADNTEGTSTYDGTLTNMAGTEWTTSAAFFGPKNCLDFDGSNDYVEIPDDNTLDLTDTYTIEAWIYPESFNFLGGIVSKYQNGGTNGFTLRLTSDSPYTGIDFNEQKTATGLLAANKWYHVAAVHNGSSQTLYINGIEVSLTGTAITNVNNSDPVRIGCDFLTNGTTGRYFDGRIDEVRIWSDVRTQQEIRENMCKTLNGNESDLAAYYSFDNSSGTILQDIAANMNDGALTNMDGNTDWVSSSAFNTWLNTSSSDWSEATNWSLGTVPGTVEPFDNLGVYSYSGGTDLQTSAEAAANHMVLGSASSMSLTSGMTITGNLLLESDLDLNGTTIYLMEDNSRLVEDLGTCSGTGSIVALYFDLSNISSMNVAGLGAEITTSANMGSTNITRSHEASSNPESINRKYVITPTNNSELNATLVFHYTDEELNGQTESNLKLYKSDDGNNWLRQNASTADTEQNTVTLTGIDGFSEWTASEGLYLTGNALELDGNNQYGLSSFNLNGYSEVTLEAWVNLRSFNSSNPDAYISNVVGHQDASALLRIGDADGANMIANNRAQFVIVTGNGGIKVNGTTEFSPNTWYHIVGTYDGSEVKLYVNGILEDTKSLTGSIATAETSILIGIEPGSGTFNRDFDGQMDEIRIWSDARTAQEIHENMFRSLIGDEQGLVAYYNCNSASGTTLYDISGNGKNATLYNSPTWVDSEAFTSWLGSTSSDWNTASNWTDGVPTATDNAGIYNNGISPVLPDGETVNNMLIASGVSTELAAGNTMDINGNLFVNGTFTLKSGSSNTASLIVNGTASGTINAERYMTGNKWHMVSSPVRNETISDFLSANTNIPTKNINGDPYRGMMDYNITSNTWNNFFYDGFSGNLTEGKGFSLRTDADGVITFTGDGLLTGTLSKTLERTGDNGWNLMGNSFTSALNANSTADAVHNLLTANALSLDESYVALYIWDEQEGYDGTRSDYVIINHAGQGISGKTSLAQDYIQSGQGFFVKAATNGASFNMTNAMQAHQPGIAFKNAQKEWSTLVLEAAMGETIASTSIKLRDDMTTGLDIGYDAGSFKKGFDLYSQLVEDNGVDFGLQCLPLNNLENIEIPIGLDVKETGEIIFSLNQENLPNELIPVLNDKLGWTRFAFKNPTDTYSTKVDKSQNGYGRFTLTFSGTTSLDNVSAQSRFKAWYSDGSFIISGLTNGEGVATLYNIRGQKIATTELKRINQNRIDASQTKSGVYLIKVEDAGHIEMLKVVKSGR